MRVLSKTSRAPGDCLFSWLPTERFARVWVARCARAVDIENKEEEIVEFNVEVSVTDEHVAELDKVVNYLNENGCGMMRLLKATGMFKVFNNVKRM